MGQGLALTVAERLEGIDQKSEVRELYVRQRKLEQIDSEEKKGFQWKMSWMQTSILLRWPVPVAIDELLRDSMGPMEGLSGGSLESMQLELLA